LLEITRQVSASELPFAAVEPDLGAEHPTRAAANTPIKQEVAGGRFVFINKAVTNFS
jgi:hypothetical protein